MNTLRIPRALLLAACVSLAALAATAATASARAHRRGAEIICVGHRGTLHLRFGTCRRNEKRLGVTRARAHSAGGSGTITTCVNKKGVLTLVTAAKKCKHGEKRLKWNVTGPPGPTGATGATGPTGPTGPKGEGEWMGYYSSGKTYSKGQFIDYEGSTYISLINGNTGNPPSTSPSDWALVAAEGSSTIAGESGVRDQLELTPEDEGDRSIVPGLFAYDFYDYPMVVTATMSVDGYGEPDQGAEVGCYLYRYYEVEESGKFVDRAESIGEEWWTANTDVEPYDDWARGEITLVGVYRPEIFQSYIGNGVNIQCERYGDNEGSDYVWNGKIVTVEVDEDLES